MARSDDRDLGELLDDLEGTLGELRAELDDREGRTPRDDRRPAIRSDPPTPGELLRFTGDRTIPTVIATLEATIRTLELVRDGIRLMAPDANADRGSRPLDPVGRGATAGAERTLDRLRTTLAGTDLPSDPAVSELVEEARALSEEIERRLAVTDRPQSDEPGVGIEVREEGDGEDRGGDTTGTAGGTSDAAAADPTADVAAELASIKEELDESGDDGDEP
jgi:hypothetical protein